MIIVNIVIIDIFVIIIIDCCLNLIIVVIVNIDQQYCFPHYYPCYSCCLNFTIIVIVIINIVVTIEIRFVVVILSLSQKGRRERTTINDKFIADSFKEKRAREKRGNG